MSCFRDTAEVCPDGRSSGAVNGSPLGSRGAECRLLLVPSPTLLRLANVACPARLHLSRHLFEKLVVSSFLDEQ